MVQQKQLLLTALLVLFLVYWMLFGGALFWKAWAPLFFLLSLAGCGVWAFLALCRGRRPVLLGPTLVMGLAALLSLAANRDIFILGGAWLMVPLFGLAALLVGSDLGEDRLLDGLYWAGWVWLLAWLLPKAWGWSDNRNLLAVWPVISILVILARGKPVWWAAPHAALLLYLGSRGAILGLAFGLLAWYRPKVNFQKGTLFAVGGLVLLWALTMVRPWQAFNRFSYWDQAFNAAEHHDVLFGLGPGGIFARHAIQEPPGPPGAQRPFHSHAHNLVIQVLAELGLVGGAALVIVMIWVLRSRLQGRWQISLMVALLGHCLVDLPLYFPGPLLVFMLVAGTVYREARDEKVIILQGRASSGLLSLQLAGRPVLLRISSYSRRATTTELRLRPRQVGRRENGRFRGHKQLNGLPMNEAHARLARPVEVEFFEGLDYTINTERKSRN